MEEFTELMNMWADRTALHNLARTYEDMVEHMTTLRMRIPTKETTMWRPYITEHTHTTSSRSETSSPGTWPQHQLPPKTNTPNTDPSKPSQKLARMDKQKRSEDWIASHHSVRDQWQGVAAIRAPYKPRAFELNDTEGRPIPLKWQAAAMATYLESSHWVPNPQKDTQTAATSS